MIKTLKKDEMKKNILIYLNKHGKLPNDLRTWCGGKNDNNKHLTFSNLISL